MLKGLDKKDINIDLHANEIIKNRDLIPEYLDGLFSKNEIYYHNCFNVLNTISEKKPDFLYPYWDFFVNHLKSSNHFHKTAAIIIIANLTSVDKQNKFERIFDEFYDNLKSEKTITPIYLMKFSGRIVNFKPNLEEKITKILLNVESLHPGKQIELVKSAVIESFSEFFYKAKNKNEIISFVEKQLDSESPKTRKTAKDFLKKYVEK